MPSIAEPTEVEWWTRAKKTIAEQDTNLTLEQVTAQRDLWIVSASEWEWKLKQVEALRSSAPQEPVADERAHAVAWLRRVSKARDDRADPEWAGALAEAADFIERGEHLKFSGLQAKAPETGWQPIDTAPKDKGAILGFMWIGDGPVTRVLHWDDDDGWHSDGHDYIPTHWMPLPQAPETGEE